MGRCAVKTVAAGNPVSRLTAQRYTPLDVSRGFQFADVHALRFCKPFGGFGRPALGIERDGFGRTQCFLQGRRLSGGQPLDENRETTRSPEHLNPIMRKTLIRQQSGHRFSELHHGRLNHLPRQFF